MLAEVTYNKGASYRFRQNPSFKFLLNKTVVVDDPAIIAAAQATRGFSVRIVEAAVPKKRVMRKTVKATGKKKTKKKTYR